MKKDKPGSGPSKSTKPRRILYEDGTIEAAKRVAPSLRADAPAATRPGLKPRLAAISVIEDVLHRALSLGDALEHIPSNLRPADAAQARAIVMASLRRCHQIDAVLKQFMKAPLPAGSGPAPLILHAAAAEIMVMGAAPHAAVDCANELAELDHKARHYKGLINAVLRRIAREGLAAFSSLDAALVNTPLWAWQDWSASFGEETARRIAHAHLIEPPLDISLKTDADADEWAKRLEAQILPTGTLRREAGGRIEALPGYEEGAWWVQDAAAALPVKLLGDMRGKKVIDLCAAPGGKTAQLASQGAHVVALDKVRDRLERVRENLRRLDLTAECVVGEGEHYHATAAMDAVLIDAPCSATGTIRRHPDILLNRQRGDVLRMVDLQMALLKAGAEMLKPGGVLVYSVCSLQDDEGPAIAERIAEELPALMPMPLRASEIPGTDDFIANGGALRTLPSHWPDKGGLDGFYAMRYVRR